MGNRGDFLGSMPVSARTRRYATLWQDWRGDRRLPERGDIDWAALGELRDHAILIDTRGRDRITVVHVGRLIIDVMGFDPVGYNYLDFTMPENRSWRAHLTMAQLAQPCGAIMYYMPRFPDGRVLPVELLSLPLQRDGSDTATLLFGCAVPLTDYTPTTPADPDSYLIGEGMRFIDLGYGVPKMVPSAIQDGAPLQ